MFPDQNLKKVLENFSLCRSLFKNNSDTKNVFLAVCLTIDPDCIGSEVKKKLLLVDWLVQVTVFCTIILNIQKFFDVAQYFGPAYVFVIPNVYNHFLLGHISGLLNWLNLQCQMCQVFDAVPSWAWVALTPIY